MDPTDSNNRSTPINTILKPISLSDIAIASHPARVVPIGIYNFLFLGPKWARANKRRHTILE